MAEHAGYLLIEGAISSELARKGASAIDRGLKVKHILEKITEYELPPIAADIQQAFIRKHENMKLLTGLQAGCDSYTTKYTEVGVFNSSVADPEKPKSLRNDSYIIVTIALTDLDPDNGWFILLKGSHEKSGVSSIASLKKIGLRLKPGDAVAWRGS